MQHGDVVLADRGFTVAEDIAIHGAKLQIPGFTRGKNQLAHHVRIQVKQNLYTRQHLHVTHYV